VLPARYELGFYVPEDYILHSHRRDNLISYMLYTANEAELSLFWQSGGIAPPFLTSALDIRDVLASRSGPFTPPPG
jgi:hypothetical protein